MLNRPSPGGDEVGETVASYPTYEAAQKAVSRLISSEVPAKDIAIVGQQLRSIERVTGRLGYATAARSGAVNGMLLGLLFAAIFVLGTPAAAIQLFVGVLFVGIAVGMLMSLVAYAIVRRRRDYASVMQVVADRYDVTVVAASVHRARDVLGPAVQVVRVPPRDAPAAEPPRYGQRIDQTAPPAATGENAPAPAEESAATRRDDAE